MKSKQLTIITRRTFDSQLKTLIACHLHREKEGLLSTTRLILSSLFQ
ncbi:MAG: hypothetical protein ACI8RD_003083 [Bacillariaceae sp.]|jgi:hypothetical protein